MSNIFTTGTRGVSHIMSTSNAIYIVADQPLANQAVTATSSTATAYIAHSYLINTIGTISDVPDQDVLDISGISIVPHKASAITAGPVIGGSWNASAMNRTNNYNPEGISGTLCLGIGTGSIRNPDVLFAQNTSMPARNLVAFGYYAGRNVSDVYIPGNGPPEFAILFGSRCGELFGYPTQSTAIGYNVLPNSSMSSFSENYIIGNNSGRTRHVLDGDIIGHNVYPNLEPGNTSDTRILGVCYGNNIGANIIAAPAGTSRGWGDLFIGHSIDTSGYASYTFVAANNLYIPNNVFGACFFNVDRVPVTATGVAMNMDTSGAFTRAVSSEKYKTVLGNYDGSSNFIYDLSGVCYYFSADLSQRERVGYIAEGLPSLSASDYIIYNKSYDVDTSGNYILDASGNRIIIETIESIDYKALLIPIISELQNINNLLTVCNSSASTLNI